MKPLRILVMTGDGSGPVPPRGYGGLTRLAWAAADEFARLGAVVGLSAPVQEPERMAGGGPELVPWPPTAAALAAVDCVYAIEADLLPILSSHIQANPHTLFVAEHNAPWLRTVRGLNVRHVLYRTDRLPFFDAGEARVFDQICVRSEVLPPAKGNGELLWLGRVHPDKAPDLVARFARNTDRPVRVVGPSQMREPDWPPNVIRQGPVDGAAKAMLLSASSALIYTVAPTWVGAGEGVLTEASACGLPILALSHTPGCPAGRLVLEGVTGFRRPTPEGLAALIPHVDTLDKNAIRDLMWSRLDPARAALARLEWVQQELTRLRSAPSAGPPLCVISAVPDHFEASQPAVDAIHVLSEFLVRHDERAKARRLLDLRPWTLPWADPRLARLRDWAGSFDEHTRHTKVYRDFYQKSRVHERFVPAHVDSASWVPRARFAASLVRSIAPTGTILEIGCHDGTVGYPVVVSCPAATYTGFDLNTHALDRFRRLLEASQKAGVLVEELPSGQFDVVLMAEVIEHVADPRTELCIAAARVKVGGWLFLTTPCGSHDRGLPESDPFDDDSFHHLWALTEEDILRHLRAAGLVPTWMGHVNESPRRGPTLIVIGRRE